MRTYIVMMYGLLTHSSICSIAYLIQNEYFIWYDFEWENYVSLNVGLNDVHFDERQINVLMYTGAHASYRMNKLGGLLLSTYEFLLFYCIVFVNHHLTNKRYYFCAILIRLNCAMSFWATGTNRLWIEMIIRAICWSCVYTFTHTHTYIRFD